MSNTPEPVDLERLRTAMSRLRPIEREVLFLSAGEGLRIDEIAARLGIPAEAAERHLADALCNLDRQLERETRPWWKFW